jgi:hypothetical protein
MACDLTRRMGAARIKLGHFEGRNMAPLAAALSVSPSKSSFCTSFRPACVSRPFLCTCFVFFFSAD